MSQPNPIEIQPENLRLQVEGFTNFDRELTPGKAAKAIMGELKASSSDLWKVKPQDITVMPGYNPRVQNRAYFEGVEVLAENMVTHGYMQDKPLAVYSAKIDGEDRLVLQDGHRRHAAVMRAIELGAPIKTVPVVLKERSDNNVDLTLALLHSNEGQPFTTYEKAVLAKRLKKFGWENKQIAAEFRITTAAVGQLLTMAGAPQAIAELVQNGNMSATEAHRLMLEHGAEEAARIATEGVAKAKAEGRNKVTAKDLKPADIKAKNAKKVAYELYRNLKKLRDDPAIEKKLDAKQIEEIDGLMATVEAKPKVKAEPKAEPKPKAAKKAPAAKKASGKTMAEKIGASAKKGTEIKTKERSGEKGSEGFWNQMQKQEADRKATKTAQARSRVVPLRRSER